MKLLAIETAFEACSVAVWVDGECLERFETAPRGHAERVLPWVDALLGEFGLGLTALDAIAFSQGPGSFTSLRIGISVTQGLAWGAGLGVAPVSSLRATAQVAAGEGAGKALVAMDARMGEVFTGRYLLDDKRLMRPLGRERVCDPAAVRVPASGEWHGVGNAFERCAALSSRAARLAAVHADVWPRASAVAALAADWLEGHAAWPAERAQPVYLRDRVAEKPGRQGDSTGKR